MAARQQFDGVWQAKTSQNLEGFLAEIGAGFMVRKMASKVSPKQTITVEGDKMTIITVTLKTTTSTLTLDGSDFNDQVFGKSFKGKASWQEDGSVIVEGNLDGANMVTVRSVEGDTMKLVQTCGDVVCVREFSKEG